MAEVDPVLLEVAYHLKLFPDDFSSKGALRISSNPLVTLLRAEFIRETEAIYRWYWGQEEPSSGMSREELEERGGAVPPDWVNVVLRVVDEDAYWKAFE